MMGNPSGLRDLKPGWDSHGADPPAEGAIEAAEAIYRCLAWVPMSDGRVQMEFHAAGVDVEMEIDPDGKIREIYFAVVKARA